MKKYLKTIPVIIMSLSVLSCTDKIKETYTVNEPIYLSYDNLRTSFEVKEGQSIVHPGKIYFKDNYIFVNEYQKGIHVVDNQNPSDPRILKFIEIPGNIDLAIKGNILYADSYVDLVAIDISNLENIIEVARIQNAFPYILPVYDDGITDNVNDTLGVVIGWQKAEKTVTVREDDIHLNYYPEWRGEFVYFDAVSSGAPSNNNSNFGVGGSMARFTLYDNYLYAVNNSELKLFNISNPGAPDLESTIGVGWNIETLFPYDGRLFIGSMTGMYIYSLNDPTNPQFISMFNHATSCDPVVVQGDYAYATLRAGNFCGQSESQLDVIDISNINFPKLIKSYPMEEPYGLGIDDSVLFVCDGNAGLKIYNASNPLKISQNKLVQYSNINTYDVIPLGTVLLMIGSDGLFQYDYSDLQNITQLSYIPIYGTIE